LPNFPSFDVSQCAISDQAGDRCTEPAPQSIFSLRHRIRPLITGSELAADVVFKTTNVDGVYDQRPNKTAMRCAAETLTFNVPFRGNLKVMDGTAFTLCQDNDIPIVVFDMGPTTIYESAHRRTISTVVS
jgi:uridylate kinase